MKTNHSVCPIENIVAFLGQKWTMNILRHLSLKGVLRFNDFQKLMPEISPRTLSKRLKELEAENFINKKKFNTIPPKVEYTLTKKGEDYGEFLSKFNDLAKKWD